MKKILLGLVLLVSLGIAGITESELNEKIKKETTPFLKKHLECVKESMYKDSNGNINICKKNIEMINEYQFTEIKWKKHFLGEAYFNTASVYDKKDDNLNAYKYYLKCANNNNTNSIEAQKRLNRICKESPWACK